jgi:HSP20 family protein
MMLRMDPFEEMDRMLNTFPGRGRGGMMPLDAFEKDGVYTLRFDVPGVDPADVDLTVEGSLLTVTAERPLEETEGATWLLRERPSGTHRREVRLGERLDTGNVKASYDNGVLTVEIPMRPEARPHKVAINASDNEKLTSGS